VIALLVTGYFAIKSADTDMAFSPGAHVQEWARSIEEKVKGWWAILPGGSSCLEGKAPMSRLTS